MLHLLEVYEFELVSEEEHVGVAAKGLPGLVLAVAHVPHDASLNTDGHLAEQSEDEAGLGLVMSRHGAVAEVAACVICELLEDEMSLLAETSEGLHCEGEKTVVANVGVVSGGFVSFSLGSGSSETSSNSYTSSRCSMELLLVV